MMINLNTPLLILPITINIEGNEGKIAREHSRGRGHSDGLGSYCANAG
jgi:hypothetical protein